MVSKQDPFQFVILQIMKAPDRYQVRICLEQEYWYQVRRKSKTCGKPNV